VERLAILILDFHIKHNRLAHILEDVDDANTMLTVSLLGTECMYVCVLVGVTSFQLPLTCRPGNRYRVTVRGLRQRASSVAMTTDAGPEADTASFDVTFKGSTEFRTGEGQYQVSTKHHICR